nr:LLM class flavin-dependent oxidoreductase [Sphingomonas chungangi]
MVAQQYRRLTHPFERRSTVDNDVGILLMFQNQNDKQSDQAAFREDMEFGVAAEEMGFGRIWIVEHHFDNYSMSPDNFVELAWFAGRTKRIKLGIGAAILPWNDPLRVAEKIILLDHLSEGRVLLALGRGLARIEYDNFRIPMSEARERFDEAADLVVNAIETGYAEGNGTFYKQPRVKLRPGPIRGFRDRLHTVAATSAESQFTAARLGGAMMSYVTADTEKLAASLNNYRGHYREFHHEEAPWPVLTDVTYVHTDSEKAREGAYKYVGEAFSMVVDHYDMAGDHFAGTKGYTAYAAAADAIRASRQGAIDAYVPTQLWGTPEEIIRRFRERIAITGPYTPNFQFSAGGVPQDDVLRGAELFARHVLPAITDILGEERSKMAA